MYLFWQILGLVLLGILVYLCFLPFFRLLKALTDWLNRH